MKYLRSLLAIPILASLSLISGCGTGSTADVEYIALGASDALGVGATPPSNGYVFLIRDDLENDGKSVDVNTLGIPGAEVGAIKDLELPVAKRSNPDLVTIFTGPNDVIGGRSVDSFQSALDSILSDLRDDTSAFIVIADIPNLLDTPRFQDDPDPDVTAERIQAFNSVIYSLASKYSVPVAKLSSEPVNDDYTSDSDGFHPNDKGHERIANLFYAIIGPHFAAEPE